MSLPRFLIFWWYRLMYRFAPKMYNRIMARTYDRILAKQAVRNARAVKTGRAKIAGWVCDGVFHSGPPPPRYPSPSEADRRFLAAMKSLWQGDRTLDEARKDWGREEGDAAPQGREPTAGSRLAGGAAKWEPLDLGRA